VEKAVILEVAILNIRPGSRVAFESSFAEALPLLAASAGYIDHELSRCLEVMDRYIYDPFPSVEHYEPCL
jgi:heme-degrading monooxygenase HmoA